MMTPRYIFCLTWLWSAYYCGIVDGEEANQRIASPSPAEIRALIDKLISENPEPGKVKGLPGLDYGKDFDRSKQKVVHEAIFALKKMGPKAFPQLIERWGDKRFSLTMSVGINGYMYTASVGEVCQDIVFDQIQPIGIWPKTDDDPRGKPKRPGYPSVYLENRKDALEWCNKHKDKSLYEIQLMVIDWVIERESENPKDYTDAERAYLKSVRKDLVETRQPMLRGSYTFNDIES
jgi:hypothetical protein